MAKGTDPENKFDPFSCSYNQGNETQRGDNPWAPRFSQSHGHSPSEGEAGGTESIQGGYKRWPANDTGKHQSWGHDVIHDGGLGAATTAATAQPVSTITGQLPHTAWAPEMNRGKLTLVTNSPAHSLLGKDERPTASVSHESGSGLYGSQGGRSAPSRR